MDRQFDYVIVGAGSAGCVLANRLSEDPNVSVCVLEAGPRDRSPYIHVPTGLIKLPFHKKVNYRFNSARQAEMNNREIFIPRGRTLGGTSSINGMVYIRGHRKDYDEWAEMGNPGWAWRDVEPYFMRSEGNEQFGGDGIHGADGPLNVTFPNITSRLERDFVAAAESMQYRHNPDFNGETQDGFGQHQVTQKNGRRWSAAMAYLRPAMKRPNLTVLTGSPVTRVITAGGRASGVELPGGRAIGARREVLLAAGAILSPKILMLSGIGDPAELGRHGIETAHALPGVGRNLQDHAAAGVWMRTRSTIPWGFSWGKLPSFALDTLNYIFRRKGFFSAQLIESGGFIRTSPELERPDIQIVFVPGHREQPPNMIGVGHGYSVIAVLLRPESRGSVTLSSADPAAAPMIDPQFYTRGKDLDIMVKGLEVARELAHAEAFRKYVPREWIPGEATKSRDDLIGHIRNMGATIFHPVGTCRMGSGDDAVVDSRLRVHGLEGLRVVDASIMPAICGGNTNAPAIMIGEKGADMIREDAAGGLKAAAE